jgi:excisionase family DNA binding protein
MPRVPPDQTSPFETRAGACPAVATSSVPKRSPHGEAGSARAPPIVAPLPPFVPVKEACVVGGFGRSKLYEVLGAGRVRAVKLGSKTLIDTASLLTYLDSLPAAQIRPAKTAAKSTPIHTPRVTSGISVASEVTPTDRRARPSSPTSRSSPPSSMPAWPRPQTEAAGALTDQVSQTRLPAKEHE